VGNGTLSESVKEALRVVENYTKTLNASIHDHHNENQQQLHEAVELINNCSEKKNIQV